MICVAGNISTLSDTQEKPFNDVTSDHWAYRYISSAKENGIINGDGNGNFYPERDITNEEIVKMIVCLLGYRELAEAKGGYPAGYTATASGLGITAGLNLKVNSPALRKDTAIMIYNALDVPIMAEGSKDADGNIAYSVMNGKNGKPLLTLRKKK